VNIFCKGWDFHVKEVLKISLEQNLELAYDSIQYLKRYVPDVALGVEHFFDGYKANPEYILKIIRTAEEAGAFWVGGADTNGGCLPDEIARIITEVRKQSDILRSIHLHNDMGLAVVNTMKAAECGARVLHGTINGLGERCGMADFCTLIPNLKLKMGIDCISDEKLKRLRNVSLIVAEACNMKVSKYTPYVGKNAFFHKAGVHVNAILKNPSTYHHIEPELVGNKYYTAISELSGKDNVLSLAKEYGINIEKTDPKVTELLNHIKERENIGLQYEGAEESSYLLFRKYLENYRTHFKVKKFSFTMVKGEEEKEIFEEGISSQTEANVILEIDGKVEEITASHDTGTLGALRKAVLEGGKKYYPNLGGLIVADFKTHVLDYNETGYINKVRVFLEISDMNSGEKFHTVGVSIDIYTAFLEALLDGIEYKILKVG
ncbi:MAG: homocitrate synthase/isopropylmalate synthase family protein, partial [Promethearchaeota archaeon]